MTPAAAPAPDPGTPAPGRPGDGLFRLGGVVLVAGMLTTLVAMLPLVTAVELPSAFWWLAVLLVGSGMGLLLLGLLRTGRTRSRIQRSARAATHG